MGGVRGLGLLGLLLLLRVFCEVGMTCGVVHGADFFFEWLTIADLLLGGEESAAGTGSAGGNGDGA